MNRKILEGPSLKSSVPKKTLGQFFFECAEKYGDRICQVDGTIGQTETYASVKQRSTRVAMNLQNRGITPNDVILFCTNNTLDSVIPVLATFYIGAKVANLDPSLSVRQTQHLISLTLPTIIFVEESALTLIEESLQATDVKTEIIVYGQSKKYTTLSDLTTPKDGESKFQPIEVAIHETALMFFSSGTTGLPKAICHSHYTFMCIGCTLNDYGYGGAVLHYTSFYWITAMFMLILSHMAGGYRVFCRSVEAENTFKVIEKYKVQFSFMAPILTYKLTTSERASDYDTSSLRVLLCGGTPMNTSQLEKVSKLFKHSTVCIVYGMTEAGVISMFTADTDQDIIPKKPTSCGRPFYGIKLKVIDTDTNEILGPNQKGEIRVKTPCAFTGYYKADSSDSFDEDGFIKTGDIGYYDEDDCVYLVERIKEMFKYKAWHIIPTALEAVIREHPAVEDVVVFGVPCGEDGEAPGACIVLKKNSEVTKEEIFEFVSKKVADREKLIGGITFASNLPKTPTGKLIRKEVRNLVINSM